MPSRYFHLTFHFFHTNRKIINLHFIRHQSHRPPALHPFCSKISPPNSLYTLRPCDYLARPSCRYRLCLSHLIMSTTPTRSTYNCPICLSPPVSPFAPSCGHVFCYECIAQHLRTRSTCPCCSTYVTLQSILPHPPPCAESPDVTTPDHSSTRPAAAPPAPRLDGRVMGRGADMSARELQGVIERLSRKLKEKEGRGRDGELDLLLDFLQLMRADRQKKIDKLRREVDVLEKDVAEALDERRRISGKDRESAVGIKRKDDKPSSNLVKKRKRVDGHYAVLQNHYFNVVGNCKGLERRQKMRNFSEDVWKLTQFRRFRDRATLLHVARVPNAPCADVFKASNIVSSIEFDRESEFVATAGVTRRIKIFEFGNVLGDIADEHYPVREIATSAKLSWVCWNPYIRHHLASSDYDGFVTLWDVNRGAALREYEEHESRAWSVDYCVPKPTLFASGSDDGRVKVWTTNQRASVLTIDNRGANVCSVKFHPTDKDKIAFGSVDFKVHYYDLRQPKIPLQVFKDHSRAVSYVKFMSDTELVSASVDSTIKLWNLNSMSLERTFTGHMNDKNFVGMSVTSDYIACGSEENTVYCYYKAIQSPFTWYRFSMVNPLTGIETRGGDDSQFVSSVCWCPKNPELLVAANSLGSLKVLALDTGEEGSFSKEVTSEGIQ